MGLSVARVVQAIEVGHHGRGRGAKASGQVLLTAGQHGSVVRVKVGAQHFVVAWRTIVGQALLRIVEAAQPIAQRRSSQRGQALAHAGHLLVGAVKVVHGRKPALVAHKGEATADVAGQTLVVVVVVVVRVVVRVRVVELVRDGGDRWQRLERRQRGISVAHAHAGRRRVAGHTHGMVQRDGELGPVVTAIQDRGHAGDHGRARRRRRCRRRGAQLLVRRGRRRWATQRASGATARVVGAGAGQQLLLMAGTPTSPAAAPAATPAAAAAGRPVQSAQTFHCQLRVHGAAF